MDIINKLHTCFRECQGFEFGDDFVKIFDVQTGKSWLITVEEYQPKDKKQLCAETQRQGLNEIKKTTKCTSKGKKKTWEAILKERK